MNRINIDIPDESLMVLNEDAHELSEQMKLLAAIHFYKFHKFTIKQAADFAGKSLLSFITELGNNKIPIIDYNPQDLESELESFK
ncbi:MAG: UPF0175 family protein [Candidatus Delongbacteria bacterium]|nr:UPF0175 family protein [Candidatus Delongbacteria bacterium]